MSPSRHPRHTAHWIVTIVLAVLVIILSLRLFFNDLLLVKYVVYHPRDVSNFTTLHCTYLFGNSMGWSSIDNKTKTTYLAAMIDTPTSTTRAETIQNAVLERNGTNKLKVSLFLPLDSPYLSDWTITDETLDGLTAIKGSELLTLSKQSGILIYSSVNHYNEPSATAGQEGALFSCTEP